ncbi:hypothetical protein AAFF_G00338710 [Aldrovandia affinis]|uniref:Uncharacterized protein n=1 Tax=Aldrovandia affinis TaxID=143900 RepID=A0AAD7R6B5_9TELE|nr:hypothetical protein AAFF_G00338710 [Aldrovandia affinis]
MLTPFVQRQPNDLLSSEAGRRDLQITRGRQQRKVLRSNWKRSPCSRRRDEPLEGPALVSPNSCSIKTGPVAAGNRMEDRRVMLQHRRNLRPKQQDRKKNLINAVISEVDVEPVKQVQR